MKRTGTRLNAGSATVEITPDESVPMSGYAARDEHSSGVRQPLCARALVVSEGDGTKTVGIVSVDLLNVSRGMTARIRRDLRDSAPEIDELLVSATHTHCGPYIPGTTLDFTPSLAVETDMSDTVEQVTRGCIAALVRAAERLEPAHLSVGTARNERTPINRRAAGRCRVPTGGIDPELTVLDIRTESGEETVLFNFPLHPVCFPPSETRLSPDWPAIVYDRIAAERDEATVIFLNGAAGDINPRGRANTDRSDWAAYTERIGTEITETVRDALADAEEAPTRSQFPIVTQRRDLRLPMKELGNAELLRDHLRTLDEDPEENLADRRYTEQLLRLAELDANELPATMTYVGLGSVGLLGIPGESFVEHGIDFKTHTTADQLLIAGYTDGYVGYLPTLKEFENFGYEIWTTKVAPEAIMAFRNCGIDLVRDSTTWGSPSRSW